MKLRPILYKAPMIRAILNTEPRTWPPAPIDPDKPAKWKTRRIMSHQPPEDQLQLLAAIAGDRPIVSIGPRPDLSEGSRGGPGSACSLRLYEDLDGDGRPGALWCWETGRFGEPGDQLWIREVWAVPIEYDGVKPRDLVAGVPIWFKAGGGVDLETPAAWCRGRWRSSIHHPFKLSRIRQEVVEVGVERLQDIPAEDLVAEGFVTAAELSKHGEGASRFFFRHGWDRINGRGSWESNPWVWVVTAKRLDLTPAPDALKAAVSDEPGGGS